MKKLLFIVLLLSALQLLAVDKTLITVKNSSTNSGVIMVNIHEDGKPQELQCTESAPNCVAPQAGNYWMVRLPKNHGLYDCDNVDLYLQNEDPETAQKVGEFCLNTK